MDWVNDTQKAINFIEDNISNGIDIEIIAKYVCSSKDYFIKVFSIITGFSPSEYIRNRRLTIAGREITDSKVRVIDIALKYGYETPESFAKAFIRFHNMTPSEARINGDSLKNFNPIYIQVNVKGGFKMSRKLIPNVSKLYDQNAENYMFCSCMRSIMSALNEDSDFNFEFFAGVTGDLFTQVWIEPKWQYNDSYSTVCRDTQVPIRAAFDACGYKYEYITEDDIKNNKNKYVRRIVESIDNGYPVLTFGIVGPPICSIICGYDENGEILIGWSQFTDEPSDDNPMDLKISENYFSKRNGLDNSTALIFITDKVSKPLVSDSIRKSLLNIPRLVNMQSIAGKNGTILNFGIQAFNWWAESLLSDKDFLDEKQLMVPLDTYGSCMVMLGTNMHCAKKYLDHALSLCPDISDKIILLQKVFENEFQLLNELVDFQGGYFLEKDRNVLLNRDFRIELSNKIKQIGQCYENILNIIN